MNVEGLQVLLVDDEDAIRIPLIKFLSDRYGYQVQGAANAAGALDILSGGDRRFDVAVIDQLLFPGPDGIETMRLIKMQLPEVECIIITGWGREERQRALQAGAFRYLEKHSLDYDELAMLIRTAAHQVRLRWISRLILSERSMDRALSGVAAAACSLALAEEASIVVTDQPSGRLRLHTPSPRGEKRWQRHYHERELTRAIIATGTPVMIADTSLEPGIDSALLDAGIRSFTGLPVPGENGNLGTLYVYSHQVDHFSAWGTMAMLQTLADQAGLAIDNARAVNQLRAHAGYMDALVRAGQGLAQLTSSQAVLQLAWEFVREQLCVATFYIALCDQERQVITFPIAYDNNQPLTLPDRSLDSQAQAGLSGYVIHIGKALEWDTSEERNHLEVESMRIGGPSESGLYLPLKTGEDVIGVISIQSYDRYAFDPVLKDAFRALGLQVTVALENARLFDEARRASEQMAALNETVLALGKEQDAASLLRTVICQAVGLLKAQGGGIYLLEPGGEDVVLKVAEGMPVEMEGQRFAKNEGILGEILASGCPYSVENYAAWEKRRRSLDGQRLSGVAGAPVMVGERMLGMLVVHDTLPGRRFLPGDLSLLQQFANHTGLALQKETLLDRLRGLQQVSTTIASSLELEEVLNGTCQSAVELFGVDHSGLVLFDDRHTQGQLLGQYPRPKGAAPVLVPVTGVAVEERLINERQPLVYADVSEAAAELGPVLDLLKGMGIHSIVLVPIIYHGRVLGSFSLDSIDRRREFQPEEVELCRVFADHVAAAVENARLFAITREGQASFQALFEAASALNTLNDRSMMLNEIVTKARTALGALRVAVILIGEDQQPVTIAHSGFDHRQLDLTNTIRSDGISMSVLCSGQPRFIEDVDANRDEVNPALIEWGVRAAACLPLLDQDLRQGVLWIHFDHSGVFSTERQHAMQIYASVAAAALTNTRLFEATRRHEQQLGDLDSAARNIRALKDPDQLMHEIVRNAAQLVECEAGCLFLHRPQMGELELRFPYGLSEALVGMRISNTAGLIGAVVASGQAQTVCDSQWGENDVLFKDLSFQAAAAVPLEFGGNLAAVLLVCDQDQRGQFTLAELDLLERFADQAAIALQTSQAVTGEQRYESQLGILHQVSDLMQSYSDVGTISLILLTGVTASYGLGFNRAALFLLDPSGKVLVGQRGIGYFTNEDAEAAWAVHLSEKRDTFSAFKRLLENGAVEPTPLDLRVNGLQITPGSLEDDLFSRVLAGEGCVMACPQDPLPEVFKGEFKPAGQLILVPLRSHGQTIGLLAADNPFTHSPITVPRQELLLTFASTAATIIHNVQLDQQVRSFYEAGNALVNLQDLDQVLKDIVERARLTASAAGVSMILMEPSGRVRQVIPSGIDTSPAETEQFVRPDGLSVRVLRTQQPVVLPDVRRQRDEVNPIMFGRHYEAALCLPVTLVGEPLGVMWFHYAAPRTFLKPEIAAVQLYVNQAALVYDGARRIRQLDLMRQTAGGLVSATTTSETIEKILTGAMQLSQADSAAIWLYDSISNRLTLLDACEANGEAHIRDVLHRQESRLGHAAEEVMARGWVGVTDLSDTEGDEFLDEYTLHTLANLGIKSFQGGALKRQGVLYLYYRSQHTFNEDEKNLFMVFADQAALALKKAQLFEQLGRARDTARMVAGVTALERIDRTLALIATGSLEALGCNAVTVYTYDEQLDEVGFPPEMAGVRYPEKVLERGRVEKPSIVHTILQLDQVYEAEDVQQDPKMSGPFVFREEIHSAAGVPLRVGDHKVGVMFVNYRQEHRFTADERINIELFAAQAAVAIRNAQLYQEQHLHTQALKGLQKTGAAVSAVLDLEMLLPLISERAAEVFTAPAVSLMLHDGGSDLLVRARYGLSPDYDRQTIPLARVEAEIERLGGMRPIAIKDLRATPYGSPQLIAAEHLISALVIPLVLSGKLIGLLNIYSKNDPRRFSAVEEEIAEVFANQAAVAIHNARLYAELNERYSDLHKIRGFVGNTTALEWMQMVSDSWGHSIKGYTGEAAAKAAVIRLAIDAGNTRLALEELEKLEQTLITLKEIPITAPLSPDAVVTSMRVNQVIDGYLRNRWQHPRYAVVTLKSNLAQGLDDQVTVRASAEWLRRGLEHLVENAFWAMTSTESQPMVLTVSTSLDGNEVVIRVHDTGPGFPPGYQDWVFHKPLAKEEGSRGSGVGLMQVNTIFEAFHGSVRILHTAPGDTCLEARLPVEQEVSRD